MTPAKKARRTPFATPPRSLGRSSPVFWGRRLLLLFVIILNRLHRFSRIVGREGRGSAVKQRLVRQVLIAVLPGERLEDNALFAQFRTAVAQDFRGRLNVPLIVDDDVYLQAPQSGEIIVLNDVEPILEIFGRSAPRGRHPEHRLRTGRKFFPRLNLIVTWRRQNDLRMNRFGRFRQNFKVDLLDVEEDQALRVFLRSPRP